MLSNVRMVISDRLLATAQKRTREQHRVLLLATTTVAAAAATTQRVRERTDTHSKACERMQLPDQSSVCSKPRAHADLTQPSGESKACSVLGTLAVATATATATAAASVLFAAVIIPKDEQRIE